MFYSSSKRIVAAAAAAALSASLFAQATFAADVDPAAIPNTSNVEAAASQRQLLDPQVGQNVTAPYIVRHTSDGWELDYGGPAIQFEPSAE